MRIRTHNDLDVYKIAFKSAMEIFEITKKISCRREIFFNRSNKKILQISECQPC